MNSLRFSVLLALAGAACAAFAQEVSNPLPVANIDTDDRSNVDWTINAGAFTGYQLALGDSFSLGTSGAYRLDSFTLWVADADPFAVEYSLLLGKLSPGGAPVLQLTGLHVTPTITPSAYAGGESAASFWRLDFSLGAWNFGGYDDVYFGLTSYVDGVVTAPHLLGSNAALSGVSSSQADDFFHAYYGLTSSPDQWYYYTTVDGTQISGWDKASDINFSARVTAVPEPSTYGLLGAGALAGLAFLRRRRRA